RFHGFGIPIVLDLDCNRHPRPLGQVSHSGSESPTGQRCRMNPARQLTELVDRRTRVPERVVDPGSHLVRDLSGSKRELEIHHNVHEHRLSAVMEIPDYAAALLVGRLDDPGPGRAYFTEARPLDLKPPTLVLDLPADGLVVERHRGPHAAVDLQRNAVNRDRHHAAILTNPPVAFDPDRLTAQGGVSDRAVLRWEWRSVGVLVVDRVVARTADPLVAAVVSQQLDGGVVDERPAVVPRPE